MCVWVYVSNVYAWLASMYIIHVYEDVHMCVCVQCIFWYHVTVGSARTHLWRRRHSSCTGSYLYIYLYDVF